MKNQYFNCHITRKTGYDHQLKYSAYVAGRFVSSDTLDGIKKIIKYYMKEGKK